MPNFYSVAVLISIIVFFSFIVISDRKVLFYNASFFAFVLISNLGYYFLGRASCVEEALIANKLTYIGGCSLSLFLMMLVCDSCKIVLSKFVRLAMYGFNSLVLMLSMTAGYNEVFYKNCRIERVQNVTVLIREYGPAHILFLVMMYGYLLAGICMLVYSVIKRKNLIYKNVVFLLFAYLVTVLCYLFGRKFFRAIDPVCVSYCINDVLLLFVTYNTCMYNLDEALLSSVEKQSHLGYLLFDRKYFFVGCNDVAVKYVPALDRQPLAKPLDIHGTEVLARIEELIQNYNGGDVRESISSDGKDLEISIQYLYKGSRVGGYIVRIADDSKQQEYIRQLSMVSKNKSNFLSNVSHEIRTPINSILGMNEMILRECKDDTICGYARNISSSGQTLLQLINDVLDFSKIESGKLDVIPTEYQLADLIMDLEIMIRPLIKKEDLEFVVEADANLPKTLYGDAIRIKQMVTNILTNAVKYTEKGSVHFKVSGQREGENFIFRYMIKDTGRGIREEDIGNLFNAFERVDQLKNSSIEGTGLGLTITKKFAEMMDGEIVVESTYGEGSTFTIIVPQKIVCEDPMGDYRVNSQKNERTEYKQSFLAPDVKIMAVDDVDMNLMVIKLLLKQTQCQVICKNSGAACIEAVKQEHFDLILLDHMMPDMDGVETLNILRSEHLCDDTPIIALTANADAEAPGTYLGLGFSGYLSKPVTPQLLEETIRTYLPRSMVEE